MSLSGITDTLHTAIGPLRLVELGKIKIGGLGEERTTRDGSRKWRLPRKDDFFSITGISRDARGDLVQDAALMAALLPKYGSPDGKLRQLPVRLLSNNIEDVLQARFCWYGRKTVGAFSDGETVTWKYDPKTMQPIDPPRVEEWNPAMLDMLDPSDPKHERKLFKLHANFSCTIQSTEGRWGGVYIFRTTSTITFRQLYASLLEISDKTGGVLVGMPLVLCVRPMQVSPGGVASNVFVVHLEIRGAEIQDLQKLAMQQAEFRLKFQSGIQSIERQYRKMLTAPGDEPPDEIEAIAAEFAPESEEDGETPTQPPRSKAEEMAARFAKPAAHTPVQTTEEPPPDAKIVDAVVTASEPTPPTLDDWTKSVADAATIDAVRQIVSGVQKRCDNNETLQSVLKLCMNRETEITAAAKQSAASRTEELARQLKEKFPNGQHGTVKADGPVGAAPTQPETTKPAGKFSWKDSTPEQRTQFTLDQIALVDRIADPVQGMERLAKIQKGIKESEVGKDGFTQIAQTITAAEQAYQQQDRQSDQGDSPFPPEEDRNEAIVGLESLLLQAADLARVDELAGRWEEDRPNMADAVYQEGMEMLAIARARF